jgi:tetratricopeptide (TPR) repeat protein
MHRGVAVTSQRTLATCALHNLTYDSSVHSGCVLCRRSERPPPRTSRAAAYVAFGAFVIAAAGTTTAYFIYTNVRARIASRVEASAKSDDAERELRQTAITTIAPAPLPTGLPLLGPAGVGADGYPTQYVDRPALRSLLFHRKFAELTSYFERFQDDFEVDPKREYWPEDAAATFDSAEPELLAAIDEWARATPASFAPYLARGAYWTSVAYARRGGKLASQTSAADFASMEDAVDRAAADLDRALVIRPKLVAARTLQISVFLPASEGAKLKSAIDQAIAVCPTCFVPRTKYVMALEPRWGGSYAAMERFARDASALPNPRLRFLAGYVDWDKAHVLLRADKSDEAFATLDRACKLGEHWAFLLLRAEIQESRGNVSLALADLDRAAVLRPGQPAVLFDRAAMLSRSKRWEEAGRDLLAGLRVDPTDHDGRASFDAVVKGMIYEAWEHFKAGRRDDAIRVLDLAKELAPTDPDLQKRRQWILSGNAPASSASAPVDIAALEDAVKQNPDDFRAYQRLDYALARTGAFERIIALWTEYLSRHANDGPAHLERGGAYLHLRRLPEAHADAARACTLGVSEGCARAKQLEGMTAPR